MYFKFFQVIGPLFCLTAIALGALKAHAFNLEPKALESVSRAIDYQMIHGLIITFISVLNWGKLHLVAFFLGILFFSGGIYLHYIGSIDWIVKIVPMGGTILMIGWLMLLIYNIKRKKD